jgi:hypothetical protein
MRLTITMLGTAICAGRRPSMLPWRIQTISEAELLPGPSPMLSKQADKRVRRLARWAREAPLQAVT